MENLYRLLYMGYHFRKMKNVNKFHLVLLKESSRLEAYRSPLKNKTKKRRQRHGRGVTAMLAPD